MRYVIKWDCGYGPVYALIDADSEKEANDAAYKHWRMDAESNPDYSVVGEATPELIKLYDPDDLT